jgi:hypothetical protein
MIFLLKSLGSFFTEWILPIATIPKSLQIHDFTAKLRTNFIVQHCQFKDRREIYGSKCTFSSQQKSEKVVFPYYDCKK